MEILTIYVKITAGVFIFGCVESVANRAVLAFCLGLFHVALAEYHRLGDLETIDVHLAHCFGDWEV